MGDGGCCRWCGDEGASEPGHELCLAALELEDAEQAERSEAARFPRRSFHGVLRRTITLA